MKIAPLWNSKLCAAELIKTVSAQISGRVISETTDLSVTRITLKQIKTSEMLIAEKSSLGIPKAIKVNRIRITAKITKLMIPVIFSGSSFKPPLFVLFSDNDESEFYTNLLKILSYF